MTERACVPTKEPISLFGNARVTDDARMGDMQT